MSYSASGRVLRETGAGQSSLQSPALPRRCGSRALARRRSGTVSYTHLDVYKRQVFFLQQECLCPVLYDGVLEKVDDGLLHGLFPVNPFSIRRGMPTAAPPRCLSGACVSCLSSVFRAACACVICRRRNIWPSRPCARPSPFRGR